MQVVFVCALPGLICCYHEELIDWIGEPEPNVGSWKGV